MPFNSLCQLCFFQVIEVWLLVQSFSEGVVKILFLKMLWAIYSANILTIILMSLISHIIIFVFHNIKGLYYLFILTLKLIIQFLSCSSDFWLIESINHRNELSIASIASNLRNYVRAMTDRIQFACFGNLYPIHYRVSFVT